MREWFGGFGSSKMRVFGSELQSERARGNSNWDDWKRGWILNYDFGPHWPLIAWVGGGALLVI